MEHINWYPGHMKKTRDLIGENLKLVDLIVEVADARIPLSSRNPVISRMTENKPRILALNKTDLADPVENDKWIAFFRREGGLALPVNCMSGEGIGRLLSLMTEIQSRKQEGQILKKPLRIMIVGVPNAGKSSLINRLTRKKSAKTGDRPGITRGKQWLALPNGMQLLDTPGILWPKFEDPETGRNLAFCGSVRDEIMDLPDLALELISFLRLRYGDLLLRRYRLETVGETPLEAMEQIGEKRGFLLPGGRIDYERTARTVLDEFRGGLIGRITLEPCGENSLDSGGEKSGTPGEKSGGKEQSGEEKEKRGKL